MNKTKIIGILVFVSGLGFAFLAHAANPILYFQTEKTDLVVNQEVTISAVLDTKDMTVSAADLQMSFPKDLLEAKSIKAGKLLPVELVKGKISNNNLSITLGSQPTSPVKGKGTVATIVLKALKPGKAEISFTTGTQAAAIGETGNILSSMRPLTLQINAEQSKIVPNNEVASPDNNIQTSPATENQPGFWSRLWGNIRSFFSHIF